MSGGSLTFVTLTVTSIESSTTLFGFPLSSFAVGDPDGQLVNVVAVRICW